MAKQRLLIDGGAQGETAEECAKLREEVESVRELCENGIEEARDKREEDFRRIVKTLKVEQKTKLEREEARIHRVYQQRAQEECFRLRQRQEEAVDRMQATKREIRDKILVIKLQAEKVRAEQEA